MNIRKPINYSAMFAALDKLIATNLPQVELYCEIDRLVSNRPEKRCAHLSPAQQAEQMTLRHLENLPLRRLSESEMTWLKNRTHDHRPEVRVLACEVFAERFPRAARNQKKQELSIRNLELFVNGEIVDEYGDLVRLTEDYQVSRMPPAIVRIQQNGTRQTIEPPPNILAKLLKWTVHTLEIFWWDEDFTVDPMLRMKRLWLKILRGVFMWSIPMAWFKTQLLWMRLQTV